MADQPLLLWGRHGIGKSELLEQAAKELCIKYISQDLSLMEPTDLTGLPKMDGATTKYLPPNFLPTSGNGLLVFEELNRCDRFVRTPCLQLLTARCFERLPPARGLATDGRHQSGRRGLRGLRVRQRLQVAFHPGNHCPRSSRVAGVGRAATTSIPPSSITWEVIQPFLIPLPPILGLGRNCPMYCGLPTKHLSIAKHCTPLFSDRLETSAAWLSCGL